MSKGATQVKETPAQVALAQHAQLVMQDYKQRWLPLQKNLASTIEQMGAPGSQQRNEAMGKATTDTAIQFDQARTALGKGLSNAGAAPGSGRADLATIGLGDDEAKSSGLGRMVADQRITDAYTQGLTALTQIGRGESAMVGQGMTAQAQQSGMQAEADARAALVDRMTTEGALGTAAGLAGQQFMKPGGGGMEGVTYTDQNFRGADLPTGLRGGG